MREVLSGRPSRWVFVSLWVAAVTVLVSDANRFLPPGGEKFVDRVAQGACDLLPSFDSAYALLDGQNPYHYSLKDLPNAWAEDEKYKYQYPPTHFLVYVPLVVYVGDDFPKLARIQFYLTLAAALLAALAILELAAAAVPLSRELRLVLVPLLTFVLSLNPGGQMGLERGQSDMTTSALCWGAAALFLRRKYLLAAFLASAAALLKGYGAPFCAGLVLAGLRPRAWTRTLAGVGLALALLLAPVARFLPDAIAAFPTRANMFWSSWNNQSMFNLLYVLSPSVAKLAYRALLVPIAAVTLGSWWRLRKSFDQPPGEQAAALALFTTASLILILAFSLNSIVYNVALILPGALLLALIQGRLLERASKFAQASLGLWLSLTMFALCAMSLPRFMGRALPGREYPLHAIGQLALVLVIGVVSWRGLPKAGAG
jgi:hypothetical protein